MAITVLPNYGVQGMEMGTNSQDKAIQNEATRKNNVTQAILGTFGELYKKGDLKGANQYAQMTGGLINALGHDMHGAISFGGDSYNAAPQAQEYLNGQTIDYQQDVANQTGRVQDNVTGMIQAKRQQYINQQNAINGATTPEEKARLQAQFGDVASQIKGYDQQLNRIKFGQSPEAWGGDKNELQNNNVSNMNSYTVPYNKNALQFGNPELEVQNKMMPGFNVLPQYQKQGNKFTL